MPVVVGLLVQQSARKGEEIVWRWQVVRSESSEFMPECERRESALPLTLCPLDVGKNFKNGFWPADRRQRRDSSFFSAGSPAESGPAAHKDLQQQPLPVVCVLLVILLCVSLWSKGCCRDDASLSLLLFYLFIYFFPFDESE